MQLTPTTAQIGIPYSGTFTVVNATSVTTVSVPAGLSIAYSPNGLNVIGTVTGTPTGAASNTPITVSATNALTTGCTPTTVTLSAGNLNIVDANACPAPAIISILSPAGMVLNVPYAGTYKVGPATSMANTIFPPGITGVASSPDANGTITVTLSGTPTSAGSFAITLDATNACATGAATTAPGLNASTGIAGGTTVISAAAVNTDFSITVTAPASSTVNVETTITVEVCNLGPNDGSANVAVTLPANFNQTSGQSFPTTATNVIAGTCRTYLITGIFTSAGGANIFASVTANSPAVDNAQGNNTSSIVANVVTTAPPPAACPTASAISLTDCAGDTIKGVVLAAGDTSTTVTYSNCGAGVLVLLAAPNAGCGITKSFTDCYGNTGYGFP